MGRELRRWSSNSMVCCHGYPLKTDGSFEFVAFNELSLIAALDLSHQPTYVRQALRL